ncbi:hypothetical protein FRC10_000515 [Ceratobasidium sp. 414]|nr:hypothetical protein FRC10_000515 [Ceratobasidium sp. 414]
MQTPRRNLGQKAHRALQIQEICDAVAAHANYHDAYTLLYASRVFFHSAIRYVWGVRPVDAQDVLVLLAGFTYPGRRSNHPMKVNLLCPLPAGYFDRFNIYAPHIRELRYCFIEPFIDMLTERYPLGDIQLLLDKLGSTVLLPSLTRVTLRDPNWTMSNLNLLGILISPSVAHFAILGITCFASESGRFLEFLGTRVLPTCPNLQDLSLSYTTQEEVAIPQEDICKLHQSKDLLVLTHLSSITLDSAVLHHVELIDWLSRLPHLSMLTIWNLRRRNRPTLERAACSNSSFQNLRVLILEYCELDEIVTLWGTPMVSRLTETKCSIIPLDDNAHIETLFSLMANYSPQLTKISVTKAIRAGYGLELCLMPGEIKTGSYFGPTELSIRHVRLYGPRPMCAIASIWPSLCKLELANHFVEEGDFIELPERLPNLEYLTIGGAPLTLNRQEELAQYRLDTMPKSPAVSALTLNTYLTTLLFNQYSQFALDQLARFFSRWWPNMRLEVPNPIDESERLRGDAYKIINRRILEFSLGDPAGGPS